VSYCRGNVLIWSILQFVTAWTRHFDFSRLKALSFSIRIDPLVHILLSMLWLPCRCRTLQLYRFDSILGLILIKQSLVLIRFVSCWWGFFFCFAMIPFFSLLPATSSPSTNTTFPSSRCLVCLVFTLVLAPILTVLLLCYSCRYSCIMTCCRLDTSRLLVLCTASTKLLANQISPFQSHKNLIHERDLLRRAPIAQHRHPQRHQ